MADTDLSKVLNECCEAARSWYELASEEKGALDGILSSAGEKIRDQKTLTDWTGKLLGSMFGVMDENNLKGNYTPKDFEKMKNYY